MAVTTAHLESLGGLVKHESVVASIAFPVEGVAVSYIAQLVNADRPRLLQILVGRESMRYVAHLEDLIRRTGSGFIGRDIMQISLVAEQDIPDEAVDFTNSVLQAARQRAPESLRAETLGTLLDIRYLDGSSVDPYDTLPHPDWVSRVPTILGLGSVGVGAVQAEADTMTLYQGSYPWRGDSRLDHDYAKYADIVDELDAVKAESDTMYVADARTLLHAGPVRIHGPRVLARVFAAPLDQFVPLNCYN